MNYLDELFNKTKPEVMPGGYANSPMDPDKAMQDYNVDTLLANAPPIEAKSEPEVVSLDPDLKAKRDLYNQHVLKTQTTMGPMAGLNSDKFTFGPNGEEPKSGLDADTWERIQKQYDEKKKVQEEHDKANVEEAKRLAEKLNKARVSAGLPPVDVPGGPISERGMAESLPARSGDNKDRVVPEKSDLKEMPAALQTFSDNKPDENLSIDNLPRMKTSDVTPQADYMKALLAAQDQSRNLAGLQMMGKGAERIGAALANAPHDKEYLNEMTPMIQQPVTDVVNQQKVSSAGLEEQMKRRDLALKQDMDDPKSRVSDIARQILSEGAPSLDTKNLTATEMNQLIPGLKTVLEAQLNREAKLEAMNMRSKAALEKDKDKKEQHIKDKQAQADMNINRQLSTARSMPAVMQAEKDIYAAAKAAELFHQYPDPNKMPMAQAKMLTIEIAKIAQGGIPTKTELDALTPNSLSGQLSVVWGKLKNSPSPANASAFLKEYKNYAEGITKQAQKVLEENYTRILETAKPHMSSEGYQLANDQFVNRFKPKATQQVVPEGNVKIRRISDGVTKTLSTQDATEYLQDPKFELVK